jgi:2-polyprenyl-3-methyl-5-hydroxy-6-metoxy-1,4-benzoquinol methylase
LPKERFEFPYHQIDLNQNFGERFGNEMFDAVCIVEVIEQLENPRHTFRQIKVLLKKGRSCFSDTSQYGQADLKCMVPRVALVNP